MLWTCFDSEQFLIILLMVNPFHVNCSGCPGGDVLVCWAQRSLWCLHSSANRARWWRVSETSLTVGRQLLSYLRSLSSWITGQSWNTQFTLRDIDSTRRQPGNTTSAHWDVTKKHNWDENTGFLSRPFNIEPHYLFSSGTKGTWVSVGARSAFGTLRTVLSTGPQHAELTLQHKHTQTFTTASMSRSDWTWRRLCVCDTWWSSPGLLWFPCLPWNLGNRPRPEMSQKQVLHLPEIVFLYHYIVILLLW